MFLEPKVINNSFHVSVASAYIAEDGDKKKVHVINAVKTENQGRDGLYADFRSNLDLISGRLEKDGESFDLVDIRFCLLTVEQNCVPAISARNAL